PAGRSSKRADEPVFERPSRSLVSDDPGLLRVKADQVQRPQPRQEQSRLFDAPDDVGLAHGAGLDDAGVGAPAARGILLDICTFHVLRRPTDRAVPTNLKLSRGFVHVYFT